MKVLANILIWSALAATVLSAATAYLASLDAPDDQLLGRTLAAPAGRVDSPDGTLVPIARKDEPLSKTLLAELRAANVENVRVKEFDLRRWRGKWYFLGSLGILATGGMILRRAQMRQRLDVSAKQANPFQILESIRADVRRLRDELAQVPVESALELIVQRVGAMQRSSMAAFADSRDTLTATFGVAGFASIMDSFASAERQLNRAWSAAVDREYAEAIDCLDQTLLYLDETQQKQGGQS